MVREALNKQNCDWCFPVSLVDFLFFFFFHSPIHILTASMWLPLWEAVVKVGIPDLSLSPHDQCCQGPKGSGIGGGGIRRQHWGPTRCHQHSSLSVKAATSWGSGHVRSPFRTEILGRTDSEVFGRLLQTECASLTFICWNPNPHSDGIRRWKPLGGD